MAALSAAPAAEAFVRISHLGKTFRRETDSVEVLRKVSINVPDRQFISILGASGCGKTTLLMMIAGLESISSGNVEIAGQPVRKPRRDVGIIFQDPTLLPWKTALENVLFPIEIFGLPLAEYRPRAQELLELVALGDFMHLRPRQLSGGMRQRVAICRALIHAPAVLLMDEPFSALDAITRDELNLMLVDVWERYHQTAFFVTHSIREAVFLSDRVVVLGGSPGQVVADVSIPFDRPRAPALGETPGFNRICGELRTAIADSTAKSRRERVAGAREPA